MSAHHSTRRCCGEYSSFSRNALSGSKENLFTSSSKVDLAIPNFLNISDKQRGRAIVRYFFERWEGDDAGDELPALLRMSVTHPDGRAKVIQVLLNRFTRPSQRALPA
jgi:Tetracyclin repressor-like, C-terminal domain